MLIISELNPVATGQIEMDVLQKLDAAGEQLMQQRENMWRLLDLSDDMFLVAKADGTIIRLNAAWSKALGWSREEFTAMGWKVLVHPDDLEKTEQEVIAQKDRDVVDFKNRYRDKDGRFHWFSWKAIQWTDQQVTYAMARELQQRGNDEQTAG